MTDAEKIKNIRSYDSLRLRLDTLRRHIYGHIVSMLICLYTHIFIPIAAKHIRRKNVIRVIFLVADIGMWKTEELYLAMSKHPRFNPVIRVVTTPASPNAKRKVIEYLDKKGYPYDTVDDRTPLQHGFHADIIFFQQPYGSFYLPIHRFKHNLNALFCFCSYGVHNILSDFICNQFLHNLAWQYYFENESCAAETARYMSNKGRNIVVTGVPMFDRYTKPRDEYAYNWKLPGKDLKRIIYAPHFSFEPDSTLHYSTFLENGEFMLELARKYADKAQFVFKPHPLLQPHLYAYWGKEKTDAYYAAWDTLPNAKVELGQYVDLFMTSDAMIHDCSSFTNEYMFTCNPVMYLLHSHADAHASGLNTMAREAFELHCKGVTHEEIEDFVCGIIAGRDTLRERRNEYFEEYLKPINGKPAVDNIIEAILGK